MTNRLLIVSNRLPVTARAVDDGVRLTAASGGLATGLRPWHESSGGLWIGWPGDVSRFTPAQRSELDHRLHERAIVPVHLSPDQIDRYYHGFSNRVLWPMLHYLIDRVPVDAMGWDAYAEVNEAFADAVAGVYRDGDMIWVHDYQLMLLPGLLRKRVPRARIGFFLHVPFPSSEVFRILPWRSEVLNGLLGADLVGFHTFAYVRHFVSALFHLEGLETDIDRLWVDGREVRIGAFPMGVDAAGFAAVAETPEVVAEAEAIRREAGGRKIVVGVDRLDYTKGILRRLQAVARLLAREPDLRDRMRYIQVAVPSRGEVESYRTFKREVEKSVGEINATCGTLRSAPVHYIHRSLSQRQLVGLYRAADVMLVTPLRDGMNLVAKEFAASRVDEDGVLVLSEFAGAAAELDGAVVVNPYDIEGVAGSIQRALSMPAGERHARMAALRRRVAAHDIHEWADGFLERLASMPGSAGTGAAAGTARSLASVLAEAHRAPRVRLLLDYDGTLVPLVRSPELAAPDPEALELLGGLAALPGMTVDIVSGRMHETLEAWLGHLPVSLWAEHGFWYRAGPDEAWQSTALIPEDCIRRIQPILQQFTASTPGSHVETKSASVAWHYRRAEREFGARQAQELRMVLSEALSNQPYEVLDGHKVIEVRLRGVSKALVARRMQPSETAGTLVIAIGDDRTDDDLFRALPESCVTVAVGSRPTRAKYRVADHRAVRQILRGLLDALRDAREEPETGAGRAARQA
jgi:trehalose 6-phosphate synthase/phosphatase